MLTINELKERLANEIDEVTLMEAMEITSDDLVERFTDIIERYFPKFNALVQEVEEEDGGSE